MGNNELSTSSVPECHFMQLGTHMGTFKGQEKERGYISSCSPMEAALTSAQAMELCFLSFFSLWCDSIVRSGWLNVVPSQHCSPEALKHFGDKHYLAVKRATEEKAYQMCSQWAVSCIIRHELQIRCRLKFDARQQSSVPAALPCVQAPV